jgi:hypothetical protein
MRYIATCVFLVAVSFSPIAARANDADDAKAATKVFDSVMPKAEAMVIEGRYGEAKDLILKAFPEKSRTSIATLMLANVLTKQDPELSYALHKQTAAARPNDAAVQLEWAMEQHRAKEYATAGDAYAKVIKLGKKVAGIYGLRAECLIRTDKIKDAADVWKLSEEAEGSLEEFETWVCDVNGGLFPDRKRAELLPKVAGGDIASARDLIALDAAFRTDWWNARPNAPYLVHDLALLRKTKFADKHRQREVLCMGDCAAAADDEAKDNCLRRANLLIGDNPVLPEDGVVMSYLLSTALATGAISKEDAKAKWGKVILDKAKATKDAELFNIAANFNVGSDKMTEINRAAWQATGDDRFAASLVLSLAQAKKFSPDNAEVKQILQKVPENWLIAQVNLAYAASRKLPLRALIVQSIKVEYTHFSLNGPLSPRPGANNLRRYFAMLAKYLAEGGK